jgi:hypothetical protein
MTKDEQTIRDLADRVEELEEEIDDLRNPPPDWFAQHETYEQLYARLHAGYPDKRGTQPAPWSW